MAINPKLDRLKLLLGNGDSEDDLLLALLTIAGEKILRRRFPFDATITTVPIEYTSIQVEIAQYLYNRRGSEGQTSHSENGVSRSYESADVPDSMVNGILPFVGVT